ncbi:MAG TPA: carbohydrate binding domain-containing protein, partial [Opitutus sp.]|nr:carbohydrate binding domain-containing protein [Opitutus sp.]
MLPHVRFVGFVVPCFLVSLAGAALQPFTMPWNDASTGITNLQSWQEPIPTTAPRVSVTPAGHYQLDGKRLRFLGVNVTSADAFPSRDRAEAHAARLARFGFNAVRFHHLEAPWDKANVLVDYASGSSRTLSAERLDRLHYFVAQLAAHGIHSDINLLVSREFQATDGLGPEIVQLGWKDQHILGFFDDRALSLHREYATKLLTAPNPYRNGLSLAQDPAVAFVEIMNENGLLQKWYENVLDTLPAPYAAALQSKWNSWLKSKYASTAALLAGWGAIDEPLGANRLVNGSFSAGDASWTLERHSGAAATATAANDFTNQQPSLRIAVTTAGTAGWHVQFTQGNLSLEAGKTYTLSFWAKASAATPLSATLTRTGPSDYSAVNASLNATLGITWQNYTATFQASTTEPSVRLVFNGFGDRVTTVSLADVKLQPGGAIGGLPAGVNLESSTIPIVKHNPSLASATAAQTRDWVAFVLGAEKSYWEAMKSHLENSVGYAGIVWATILSNSAPNTQVAMDAMDSHSYWQHPVFPAGHDFDPELWTVANTSMVNSPDANTLTGIARQRVRGRPHNVTEYEHAAPNTYGSEGPLLVAMYGALQDWDSIWFFDYKTGTSEFVTGYFDHGGHAGKLANNLLAAAMFRRGDVASARQSFTLPLTPTAEIETARTRGGAWSIADGSHLGMPAATALISRVDLSIGENASGLATPPAAPAGNVFAADTGELRWDVSAASKGVVTLDTPRSKALVGFVNGRSFNLGGVIIAPGGTRQDWCTIGLTLLEGYAFDQQGAARAVLVATGDQENTGQVWKDATHTSLGSQWGNAPTLVEVIPATITLPVAASRVSVWALDGRGARTVAVPVVDHAGRAQFVLGQSGTTLWYEIAIAAGPAAAPSVLKMPAMSSAEFGDDVSLSTAIDGSPVPEIAWLRNGSEIEDVAEPTLSLLNFGPAQTGLYRALLMNAHGTMASAQLIVGGTSNAKVIGEGREVDANVRHPNGNTFDQVLVTGPAEAVTADYTLNQITRTSFIDLNHDIVQVEFSGPGTLSLVLQDWTPPAPPQNYNQGISYMRGRAGIVIVGADERTNLSIFTVGRATANDPTGHFDITKPVSSTNDPATNGSLLFVGHANTHYDGIADVAFVAIASTNGRFGGLRAANAHFSAERGLTGVYAPGVAFTGPVYLGNIAAEALATPAILLGSASDVRITGGSLLQ